MKLSNFSITIGIINLPDQMLDNERLKLIDINFW